MQRLQATKKQHVLMVVGVLMNIAISFPTAMSGKMSGVLMWLCASALALLLAITRIKAFAAPVLIFSFLFALSFVVPADVVLVRHQPSGISWLRCEVVSMGDQHKRPRTSTETNYVIVRGCIPILGVEPSRVLKISIP